MSEEQKEPGPKDLTRVLFSYLHPPVEDTHPDWLMVTAELGDGRKLYGQIPLYEFESAEESSDGSD